MNTNEPRSDASAAATDNASGHEPVVSEVVLRCIEALLMASDGPLSVDQIVRLLETTHAVERADVRVALAALAENYAANAVNVVEVAGGWRFQVGADYAGLVSRLWEERPPKLSRAMLETLALICYRQPIARSDIEAVRGVSVSSNIVKTLQEFDWIKVVGYRDMPGRPALFGTTTKFLDDFGVKRLSDLPSLPEIKDLDALDAAIARLQGDSPSSETGEIGETGESGAEDEPETGEAGDPSGESASPGDERPDTDNTGANRPPASDSVH